MAAVLSKTAHLRRTYRLFSTYTASRLTPHFSDEIPLRRPLLQSDHFQSLPRFLSTNANAAGSTAKIETDSTLKDTVSDAHSDKGKESGDSHQSSEQGKSVRGGPISWLSFLLLIASGAGVIFYYDQEKKRHIEVKWWGEYGDDTPKLKEFAMKILGLTCSASACERNWCMFKQVHTKRRNRLTAKRMNDLVYIMYNKKLKHKFVKKGSLKEKEDPLLVEYLQSDDEWIAELDGEAAIEGGETGGEGSGGIGPFKCAER
ncbi:hypothetical protein SSX86_011188 [Deinandra increscens subsp. villosa]|uniref:HAT C-terminal dimerisation domain-containing protein n=1 Tax=Deinandra increscens subsp. villosa TaxID=3103831 RepID=A0AAP0H3A2_9ASTR